MVKKGQIERQIFKQLTLFFNNNKLLSSKKEQFHKKVKDEI